MAQIGGGGEVARPRKSDRQRQIQEAATDLFLEFGYEGATLDLLIDQIGGSRRDIYNLFDSKQGLLTMIVNERCDSIAHDIRALSLEGLEPRAMLQKLGLGAVRVMLSSDGVKLFRLVVQESARNPQLGRLLYEKSFAVIHVLLGDYFTCESRAGRLHIGNPDEASRLFVSMIIGDLYFVTLFWGVEKLTEAYLHQRVEHCIEMFLEGVSERRLVST